MSDIETYLRGGVSQNAVQLPDDWWPANPSSEDSIELYAMPAATPAFLSDQKVDLKKWLVEEIKNGFRSQIEKFGPCTIGPVSVLRDAYSARPYILFYATAKASRAAAMGRG